MDYRAVDSLEEVQAIADELMEGDKPVSFDLETGYDSSQVRESGSLRVYEPTQLIAGIALTNSKEWARYIPFEHSPGSPVLPTYETWEILKPVFEEKKILAHNYLFDYRNIQALPKKGTGPEIIIKDFDDTLLMSYVLAQTRLHGLKYLTGHYFDYEQAGLKTLFPNKEAWTVGAAKKLRFNELPVSPTVVSYVLDDARWVIALYEMFTNELNKPENKRLRTIYAIEKEILLILADMQNTGFAFDWDKFDADWRNGRLLQDYMLNEVKSRFLEDLGQEEFEEALNFNSAAQVRKLLYEDLGLTTGRMTKAGLLSTDQVALKGLADKSKGAAKLGEYKKYLKNLDFYETWDAHRQTYDARIHSNLSQTLVPSGRFASSDPNSQNIRKTFWFQAQDGEKEDIRKAGRNGINYWEGSHRSYVIPTEGYTLLSYDVSNGEVRVLAGLAGDKFLLDAFASGRDIHMATASLAFGVPYELVTKDERQSAKAVTFGLLYGQGVKALGEGLNISEEQAQEVTDKYFGAFSSVRRWIDTQHELAYRLGFVETFMGRRVTLWDMQHVAEAVRAKGARLSVNAVVQGGLADIVKVSMLRASNELKRLGWWGDKVRLLMNQHDSLVFEVHNSLPLEEVYAKLKPAVQFNPSGTYGMLDTKGRLIQRKIVFPDFITDWEYGSNWGDMKAFE